MAPWFEFSLSSVILLSHPDPLFLSMPHLTSLFPGEIYCQPRPLYYIAALILPFLLFSLLWRHSSFKFSSFVIYLYLLPCFGCHYFIPSFFQRTANSTPAHHKSTTNPFVILWLWIGEGDKFRSLTASEQKEGKKHLSQDRIKIRYRWLRERWKRKDMEWLMEEVCELDWE